MLDDAPDQIRIRIGSVLRGFIPPDIRLDDNGLPFFDELLHPAEFLDSEVEHLRGLSALDRHHVGDACFGRTALFCRGCGKQFTGFCSDAQSGKRGGGFQKITSVHIRLLWGYDSFFDSSS